MTRAISLDGLPPSVDIVDTERHEREVSHQKNLEARQLLAKWVEEDKRARIAAQQLEITRQQALLDVRNAMPGPPRPLTARDAYAEEVQTRERAARAAMCDRIRAVAQVIRNRPPKPPWDT